MKDRTHIIILRTLEVLRNMPDGLCSDGVLKSSVDLLVTPNTLVSEFREAIRTAEARNWILGVRPEHGDVKWSLTDGGTAYLLKQQ